MSCCVYLIGHSGDGGISGPIKCGVSQSPPSRLSELQTGSPRRLAIVASFALPNRAAASAVEELFHEDMAERRLEGEWFALNPLCAVSHMATLLAELCASLWEGEAAVTAFRLSGGLDAALRCEHERAQRLPSLEIH